MIHSVLTVMPDSFFSEDDDLSLQHKTQWQGGSLPGKLRRLVEVILENVRCKVKTQNRISDPFITGKGLRQGNELLCMLFNIDHWKI
jgi:hypothetical protein